MGSRSSLVGCWLFFFCAIHVWVGRQAMHCPGRPSHSWGWESGSCILEVCVHGDVSPAHTSVRIRSRLLSVLSRQLLYAGADAGRGWRLGYQGGEKRVTDANATTAQTHTDSQSGTE
ncbi:unnamed protein product [Clonostachys rosea f. rosea IK726]|uniref:Uncharacterized protein n=1 Tax=Clonostachys rosea f. rosea IK726 TaxID=1349383 RepID=A0ACA9TAB9_BIOOC|nr:unnamed protein product [Clonostachys rosea f. rosea IK726]